MKEKSFYFFINNKLSNYLILKLFLLALLSVFLLTACTKDNVQQVPGSTTPQSFKDKIVLNDLDIMQDSVVLTWTKLDTANFQMYVIWRKDDPMDIGVQIGTVFDKRTTRFTDKTVPYTPFVEYEIRGVLGSGNSIYSNKVTYTRSGIKLINTSPFDVLFSKQERLLYFFEKNGDITQYSLQTGQVVKKISTAATIGYCDFGTYNNRKELYVPRNDGWVFVYDAITLEKIDQLNVGLNSSCVVFNNNTLFVSTSTRFYRPLKVYNRATKTLLSETGDFELTRFKLIPGSNTELLEITINVGPVDQDYYTFSPAGSAISHLNDMYHGDYPLDHKIFEIFPSGNKYITSSSGTIYNKGMNFEASLPKGNLQFTTFDFDVANNHIYAGTTTRTVEVYTADNYTKVKSIPTKAYPFKLFKDGTGFICVSSTTAPSSNYYQTPTSRVLIEEIK
jgi:hypothetical protein